MDKTSNKIVEKLSNVELFKGLNFDELKEIVKIIDQETYNKNEYIINEGELGSRLYIIMDGTVRVLKKTFSNEFYTVVDLSEKQHAFFGEFSLLDNEKRSASILTITKCDFLMIENENFTRLTDKYPKIGFIITKNIAKRMSKRLRTANNDIVTLFQALEEEITTTE